MLIQHGKATNGVVKPGGIIGPRKTSYIINGDFNKGLNGWAILQGAANVEDGNMRVWGLDSDGNVAQDITNRLKSGWIYKITVNQLGGVGNGQWFVETAPGAADLVSSSGSDGIESQVLPYYGGNVWIRLVSIFAGSTEYCDFAYVDIERLEPV